jgi:PKD repeat protein
MKAFIYLFILIPSLVVAQINRARTWVFGESIGIKFQATGNIDTLLNFYKPSYPQFEGTGVYNDTGGNLLYYVLNGKLINSDHKPLNQDFSMGGSSSASQANIITSLNDSVFHIFGSSGGFNYNYSSFDRTAGKFRTLGKSLIYRASEAQALVNHQNGRWQWVVCHSRLGDTIYSYLITDDGIETCPVISHAGPFYNDWYPGQGVMKFSPDGKYLFFTTWSAEKVVVCAFNNQTGAIKELVSFYENYPYSIEIVENKLLVANRNQILEFDCIIIDSTKIVRSRQIIYDTSDIQSLGQIQRAPDGKMYVAYFGGNRLGVLSKVAGIWQHSYRAFNFGTKKSYAGFPTFNASYFYTPALNINYTRNCKTNTFQFTSIDTIKANSWNWLYTKGNKSYTGSGKQTNYAFPDTGVWQVRCIASNGSRTDTVTKTIEILNPLTPSYLGEDILLPQGAILNGSIIGPKNMHCTHWQRLGDTLEKKGQNYLYNDTGYYICKATNRVFCSFTDTIRVRVCDSFAHAAVIQRMGDSLFTRTYAAKYQWYLNNSAISGATNKHLRINQTGSYKLRTWNKAGCDSLSAEFEVIKLGISNYYSSHVSVFPNPNNGNFTLQSNSAPINEIVIYDVTGKLVYHKKTLNAFSEEINAFIGSGIYYMKVNDFFVQKIVIF